MIDNVVVRDWMSTLTITVSPIVSISNAHQIMKENGIRRLPLVENGRLVGIITIGDVREASPSDATSLSIWEMNYLWAQLTVEKVMSTKVITVGPEDTLIDAAQLMLDYKISGLPVIDRSARNRLVGILTESDIFRMLVKERSQVATAPNP